MKDEKESSKKVEIVNNLSIKAVQNSYGMYELQLNDQYFQVSEDQIEMIDSITSLPSGTALSAG